jgi:formyltetrahydrofolate-dependent phosphoribosylglycinamide formyltransferase
VSVPVAVLASGGGSNLQALIDDTAAGAQPVPYRVALVISDRAGAGALERARRHGIPALHLPVRDRPEEAVADELLAACSAHDIGLIALAGYLRLVPPPVTAAYSASIINIHPALLPAFGGPGMYGLHVHRAVIAAGCTVSGATVHRVTDAYDAGRIIAQWPVPVLPGDTAEELAARVRTIEHLLYPAVVRALAGGTSFHAPAPAATAAFRLAAGDSGELRRGILHLARL